LLITRLKQDIAQLYEAISKQPIPAYKKFLEMEISGEMLGNSACDCLMPTVKYSFRK